MWDMNATDVGIRARLDERKREVSAMLEHRSPRTGDRMVWLAGLRSAIIRRPSRRRTQTTVGRGPTVAER
jgi:hypothetical protein